MESGQKNKDLELLLNMETKHANHYTTDAVTIEINILRNYRY
jgi:hypothetical protein